MCEDLKQVFYYGSTLGYFSVEHFNCFLCCEVIPRCGFDLHFPDGVEHLFIYLLAVFVKMSSPSAQFLIGFSVQVFQLLI